MAGTKPLTIAWVTVAVAATLSTAGQVPLGLPHESLQSWWRFDIPVPSNSTSNFIFDGVSSLLQQWGNTRYRNGHNIVPVTIPFGTLLYHGTSQNVVPTTPEWVATDPEHAYAFCREESEGSGCWMLTLAAQRPLNLLYFDGSSAAKLYGTLDAQDLIAWQEVVDTPERIHDEPTRIQRLCSWGKKYALDGFLRMAVDFEVMLCDFANGVETVSFAKLVAGFPVVVPSPPETSSPSFSPSSNPQGAFILAALRLLEAGHWHNSFPGETRATLDLTRFVSLYDTESFPSLEKHRETLERWEHRAAGLDRKDTNNLIKRLDGILTAKPARSGIDWASVYRVIVHRYADRLEAVQYMLNDTRSDDSSTHKMKDMAKGTREVHEYVASMLSLYTLHDVKPPANRTPGSPPFSWASPVFERCATLHTKFISNANATLTKSEKLLLRSVDDVLYETCRVLVGIWAEGVELGLSSQTDVLDSPVVLTAKEAQRVTEKWSVQINTLMAWLDWSVWVKCRLGCNFKEMCYLPTWPFFNRDGQLPIPRPSNSVRYSPAHGLRRWQRGGSRSVQIERYDDADWLRPQPRCMLRLPPYEIP